MKLIPAWTRHFKWLKSRLEKPEAPGKHERAYEALLLKQEQRMKRLEEIIAKAESSK